MRPLTHVRQPLCADILGVRGACGRAGCVSGSCGALVGVVVGAQTLLAHSHQARAARAACGACGVRRLRRAEGACAEDPEECVHLPEQKQAVLFRLVRPPRFSPRLTDCPADSRANGLRQTE